MVRREVQEMGTAEMAEGGSHGWITTLLACVGQWLGEGHKSDTIDLALMKIRRLARGKIGREEIGM
jgi:hypothetical protein